MKQVYKAILHGDRVEWVDDAPDADGPVEVEITVETNSYGRAHNEDDIPPVSQYLQALADMGTFAEIEDPVAWQREIRKDRPLPGRE
ncbi:hypothetical protein GBAR_LOCUS5513 [Geodia barretti]|uniref:Uncharacterized protein n=1 Tax=Geodia barretti TaxID=519541 RepID=A0AA35RAP8_GEOBA|nr:hypothetical protein GBAR_LOCUS5513 [Geodia barretti]